MEDDPGDRSGETCIGALDIGGTKILAGIIDPSGKIVARRSIGTLAERGAEDVVARCVSLMRELAREAQVAVEMLAGIGCSVPGPLDPEGGVVLFSPNLGWRNVPLAQWLRHQCGVPVEIEDDARCAASGEARRGAARGAEMAVYITISTGIGGGLIINGRVYRGAHGFAGEIGHMTLEANGPPCSCGNNGCFESLASGSAIAARARQAVLHGDETTLASFHDGPLTAEQVIQAAKAGDAVATRIVEAAGVYVGIGLAAVATAFDPQIIVLGGGVVRQEGILLRRAYETFRERALAPLGSLVPIVPAALGDESGLWGAVALIEDRIR
ncbi:MAG: ROK family protein [Chloroflexi bacterium]|nr:MAG: ROK family protein [Chloroflexota bacterium]